MTFKKAERRQVKLKIAITGPSGSGKTYSALEMAKGIGKKIALIDTENGSASLYSDRFEFDTCEISPPYTIPKYTDAIKAAIAAGYEVLVIDSITHAWAGEGGLLAKKESLDARGGNSYTNWGSITKEQELFKAALLNASVHLIVTMRSKQDYVVEVNEKGKSAPRKVGLAPIQRDGMEYEFTTVFDVAMDHAAAASKDRTGLFDGHIEKLSEETGKRLIAWLQSAKPVDAVEIVQAPKPVDVPKANERRPSEAQLKRLFAIRSSSKWTDAQLREYLGTFGKESTKDLTLPEYDEICNNLSRGYEAVMGKSSGPDFGEDVP